MGVSVTEGGCVVPFFTVSVDRSNGDKLGVAFKDNTFEITAVNRGLISAWNETHPDSLVKPTDLILEVNGKDFDKHGPTPLQEELKKQQVIDIKLGRSITFSVLFNTHYGKLGFQYDPETLQITGVDDIGLVAAWNLEQPAYSVLIGDRIRAVNGMLAVDCTSEGAYKVHEALQKRGFINIIFTRPANAEETACLLAMQTEDGICKPASAFLAPPRASTFIVYVSRPNGEDLGLSFETDSLTVNKVNPEGLIVDWNQIQSPGVRVQPSDQIMEVNGKHVSVHGVEGLLEVIQHEPILQLTMARAVTVCMHIDKSFGGMLGCVWDEETMQIKAINGVGLVAVWNVNHPEFAVQPGDRFIEVNGKKSIECGLAVLNAEICEQLVLELKLSRSASMPGAEANAAHTLPVLPSPIIFSIKFEKKTDSLLGVTCREKNMQVVGVDSEGLIHSWNMANPERALSIGDQILGVNSRHLVTHGARPLLEAMTGDQLVEFTVKRRKFTVWIKKTLGSKIGVTFCQDTLRVKTLEDVGLVADWNRQHSDIAICQGDRVIEVNGKRLEESGTAELIQEMDREGVLRIFLTREPIAALPDKSLRQLNTFTVQVDKSNGGKLGLQFAAGTTNVDFINKDDLIADWNASHPESKVRLCDQLLEVNGRHLLVHGAEQLHEAMCREKQEIKLVFAAAHGFDVFIQRSAGQKLGLDFHPSTLEIVSIDGEGLANGWNLARSHLASGQGTSICIDAVAADNIEQIAPGDRVVEVNGLGVDEHGASCLVNTICDPAVEELRFHLARTFAFKQQSQPLGGGINTIGGKLSTKVDEDEEALPQFL